MNLKAPIYFSTGLTEKANHYYKLFITWTNQKIRKTFVQRNMFEFKHIKAFDRSYADNPGPMVAAAALQSSSKRCEGRRDHEVFVLFQVVFATPGMLHAGQSLQIFKKWAGNEKNMVSSAGEEPDGKMLMAVKTRLLLPGHHAGLLRSRNHRTQDPERPEEAGDGGKSNGKKPRSSLTLQPKKGGCRGPACGWQPAGQGGSWWTFLQQS